MENSGYQGIIAELFEGTTQLDAQCYSMKPLQKDIPSHSRTDLWNVITA
jgi:hypothetical protein